MNIKRGQVTHIESLDNVSKIKLPICAKGYISPRVNNIHLVGSSYSDSEDNDLSEDDHLYNLNNLKLVIDEEMNVVSGQAGYRAVSKDHMPVVGRKMVSSLILVMAREHLLLRLLALKLLQV